MIIFFSGMQMYADYILDVVPIYMGKSLHLTLSYSAYTYFAILRTLMCQQTAIDRTAGGFFPPKY